MILGYSLCSSHATGRCREHYNLEAVLKCSRISIDFWSLFILRLLLLTLAFSLLHGGLSEVHSELKLKYFFLPFISSFFPCIRRCCTQNQWRKLHQGKVLLCKFSPVYLFVWACNSHSIWFKVLVSVKLNVSISTSAIVFGVGTMQYNYSYCLPVQSVNRSKFTWNLAWKGFIATINLTLVSSFTELLGCN